MNGWPEESRPGCSPLLTILMAALVFGLALVGLFSLLPFSVTP